MFEKTKIFLAEHRRKVMVAGAGALTYITTVMPAAAVDITLPTFNGTSFSDFFTAIADMTPGLMTLIGAVIGIVIMVAVAKFVPGLLESILDMIKLK